MSPEEFLKALEAAEAAGLVKYRRSLGSWTVSLTKKGRAALELASP
jgi:hypothetical protein